MILKLLLIQTSYIVISISRVNTYVLFAANPDDFRSIAKQIIPGRLADQLADIASKTKAINPSLYERKGEYTDSKDGTSVDAEYDFDKDSVLTINGKNPNTRFIVKDQKAAINLDMDELVKRVKEKLEREYKLKTTISKYELPNRGAEKIDDYYYKDDLNVAFTSKVRRQTETPTPVYAYAAKNLNAPAENNAPKYQVDDVKEDLYVEDENDVTNMQALEYKNKISNTNIRQVPRHKNKVSVGVQNIKENVETISVLTNQNEEKVHVPAQYFKQDTELNNANGENYNEENEKDVIEYYDEALAESTEKPADIVDKFKEWDMKKQSNDSYEDYVIPDRDDIFASNEAPIKQPLPALKLVSTDDIKYNLNRPKAIADSVIKVDNVMKDVVSPLTKRTTKKQLEIKAKTENLWYKDANIENYDDSTKSTTADPSGTTKKKRMNTMIPTRARFKMSSPNYISKIKAVAEKYDFNEPIPEKDREPENIKHIGNPPAFINKKVKLT